MSFTAYILDVISDTVYPARITIEDGIYKEVTPITVNERTTVDVDGLMIPGFIDSHIHIESSMITPAQFARIAVRHGTTGVVCDPHEIANVMGIYGVEAMIKMQNTCLLIFISQHLPVCLQQSLRLLVPLWMQMILNSCFERMRLWHWLK